MKKMRYAILCVLFACGFSHAAQAETGLYYGGKLGFMMFDPEGYEDPINIAAVLGYTFWRGVSVEGEFSTSLSDGDIEILGTSFDVSTQT